MHILNLDVHMMAQAQNMMINSEGDLTVIVSNGEVLF